jgi:amino acid transporter
MLTARSRPSLKERHVNMIAFSACVGIGLFLQAGKVIFLTGPGLAVFAYLIAGSILWSAVGSLGEMSALFPIQGGLFVFPARFLDVCYPSRKSAAQSHARRTILTMEYSRLE